MSSAARALSICLEDFQAVSESWLWTVVTAAVETRRVIIRCNIVDTVVCLPQDEFRFLSTDERGILQVARTPSPPGGYLPSLEDSITSMTAFFQHAAKVWRPNIHSIVEIMVSVTLSDGSRDEVTLNAFFSLFGRSAYRRRISTVQIIPHALETHGNTTGAYMLPDWSNVIVRDTEYRHVEHRLQEALRGAAGSATLESQAVNTLTANFASLIDTILLYEADDRIKGVQSMEGPEQVVVDVQGGVAANPTPGLFVSLSNGKTAGLTPNPHAPLTHAPQTAALQTKFIKFKDNWWLLRVAALRMQRAAAPPTPQPERPFTADAVADLLDSMMKTAEQSGRVREEPSLLTKLKMESDEQKAMVGDDDDEEEEDNTAAASEPGVDEYDRVRKEYSEFKQLIEAIKKEPVAPDWDGESRLTDEPYTDSEGDDDELDGQPWLDKCPDALPVSSVMQSALIDLAKAYGDVLLKIPPQPAVEDRFAPYRDKLRAKFRRFKQSVKAAEAAARIRQQSQPNRVLGHSQPAMSPNKLRTLRVAKQSATVSQNRAVSSPRGMVGASAQPATPSNHACTDHPPSTPAPPEQVMVGDAPESPSASGVTIPALLPSAQPIIYQAFAEHKQVQVKDAGTLRFNVYMGQGILAEDYEGGHKPCDIVYLPDIYEDAFMCAQQLFPTLTVSPQSRLLAIQYPGLPGTTDTLSRTAHVSLTSLWLSIAGAVSDCVLNKVWGDEAQARDIIIIGAGFGAYLAFFLLSASGAESASTDISDVMARLKCIVSINGFCWADKQLVGVYRRLREMHTQMSLVLPAIDEIKKALEEMTQRKAGKKLAWAPPDVHKYRKATVTNPINAVFGNKAELPVEHTVLTVDMRAKWKPVGPTVVRYNPTRALDFMQYPAVRAENIVANTSLLCGAFAHLLKHLPLALPRPAVAAVTKTAEALAAAVRELVNSDLFQDDRLSDVLAPFLTHPPPVELMYDRAFHLACVDLCQVSERAPNLATYVSKTAVPILLLASSDDRFIPGAHSHDIAAARAATSGCEHKPNGPGTGGSSMAEFLECIRHFAAPKAAATSADEIDDDHDDLLPEAHRAGPKYPACPTRCVYLKGPHSILPHRPEAVTRVIQQVITGALSFNTTGQIRGIEEVADGPPVKLEGSDGTADLPDIALGDSARVLRDRRERDAVVSLVKTLNKGQLVDTQRKLNSSPATGALEAELELQFNLQKYGAAVIPEEHAVSNQGNLKVSASTKKLRQLDSPRTPAPNSADQGFDDVVAALAARGLDTYGNAFDLLTRLEDAIAAEARGVMGSLRGQNATFKLLLGPGSEPPATPAAVEAISVEDPWRMRQIVNDAVSERRRQIKEQQQMQQEDLLAQAVVSAENISSGITMYRDENAFLVAKLAATHQLQSSDVDVLKSFTKRAFAPTFSALKTRQRTAAQELMEELRLQRGAKIALLQTQHTLVLLNHKRPSLASLDGIDDTAGIYRRVMTAVMDTKELVRCVQELQGKDAEASATAKRLELVQVHLWQREQIMLAAKKKLDELRGGKADEENAELDRQIAMLGNRAEVIHRQLQTATIALAGLKLSLQMANKDMQECATYFDIARLAVSKRIKLLHDEQHIRFLRRSAALEISKTAGTTASKAVSILSELEQERRRVTRLTDQYVDSSAMQRGYPTRYPRTELLEMLRTEILKHKIQLAEIEVTKSAASQAIKDSESAYNERAADIAALSRVLGELFALDKHLRGQVPLPTPAQRSAADWRRRELEAQNERGVLIDEIVRSSNMQGLLQLGCSFEFCVEDDYLSDNFIRWTGPYPSVTDAYDTVEAAAGSTQGISSTLASPEAIELGVIAYLGFRAKSNRLPCLVSEMNLSRCITPASALASRDGSRRQLRLSDVLANTGAGPLDSRPGSASSTVSRREIVAETARAGSTRDLLRGASRQGPRGRDNADRKAASLPGLRAGLFALPSGDVLQVSRSCWLAVVTRWKAPSEATTEERMWIGIDRTMFPQLYQNIPEEDFEYMLKDPAFHCKLTRQTLFRLASLPCGVQSGLALCRSKDEFVAYTLLCKFLHGEGEEQERLRDQEVGARLKALMASAAGFRAKHKEHNSLTKSERRWLTYDAVLRPWLYIPVRPVQRAESEPAKLEDATTNVPPGPSQPASRPASSRQSIFRSTFQKMSKLLRPKQDSTIEEQYVAPAAPQSQEPTSANYERAELLKILSANANELETEQQREVQILLHFYGSDAGQSVYIKSLRRATTFVDGLTDIPAALRAAAAEGRRLNECDPLFVAAHSKVVSYEGAYLSSIGNTVLMPSKAVADVAQYEDCSIRAGGIDDHVFELPGNSTEHLGHHMSCRANGCQGCGFEGGVLQIAEKETLCPGAVPVITALIITVVFHGRFLEDYYVPGKIQVHLYKEALSEDNLHGHTLQAIEEQANTEPLPRPHPLAKPTLTALTALRYPSTANPVMMQRAMHNQRQHAPSSLDDMPIDYRRPSRQSSRKKDRRHSLSSLSLPSEPILPPKLLHNRMPPLRRPPLSSFAPEMSQDQFVAAMRVPVGYAAQNDCCPNSASSLGHVVIKHEPLDAPVTPGKYCISITGLSETTYSISVCATLAHPMHAVVEGQIRAEDTTRAKISSCRADMSDVTVAIALGERKRGLVDKVVTYLDGKIQSFTNQLAKLDSCARTGEIQATDLGSDAEASDEDDVIDDDASLPTDERNMVKLAIANARKMKKKLHVVDSLVAKIDTRKAKLKARSAKLERMLDSWRRELSDSTSGLTDLRTKQSELSLQLDEHIDMLRRITRTLPPIYEAITDAWTDFSQSQTDDSAAYGLFIRNKGSPMLAQWHDAYSARNKLVSDLPPADIIRRKPLHELTFDEKEWMAADRVIRPELYDAYAADVQMELPSDVAPSTAVAVHPEFSITARSVLDEVLPPCGFSANEIRSILTANWEDLGKDERRLKQLFTKFDPPETVQDVKVMVGKRQPFIKIPIDKTMTVRQLRKAQADERANAFHAMQVHVDRTSKAHTADIDLRARELYDELVRVTHSKRDEVDSNVLGGRTQRLSVIELVANLELELDRVLLEQVLQRITVETALTGAAADKLMADARRQLNDQMAAAERFRKETLRKLLLSRELKLRDGEVHPSSKKLLTAELLAVREARNQRISMLSKVVAKDDPNGVESLLASGDIASSGGDYAFLDSDPVWMLGGLGEWGTEDVMVYGLTPEESRAAAAVAQALRKSEKQNDEGNITMESQYDVLAPVLGNRFPKFSVKLPMIDSNMAGTCRACQTKPCQWRARLHVRDTKQRINELEQEIFRLRKTLVDGPEGNVMAESTVTASSRRGGDVRLPKADIIRELAGELARVKQAVRIAETDEDLHACYAQPEDVTDIVVRLHGFPQKISKERAIAQLERESNRLIAQQSVHECLEDILLHLLEGWYFGEAKSQMFVAGKINQLAANATLKPREGMSQTAKLFAQQGPSAKAQLQDAARALDSLFVPEAGAQEQSSSALALAAPMNGPKRDIRDLGELALNTKSGVRTTHKHMLAAMQKTIDARDVILAARKPGEEVVALMDKTEVAMRFAMFMMSLMFYRVLNQVSKLRRNLSGENTDVFTSLVRRKNAAPHELTSLAYALDAGQEWSEKAAISKTNRMAAARKARLQFVQAKAVAGYAAKASRLLLAAREAARVKAHTERKLTVRNNAARTIQRVWRAVLARREAAKLYWEAYLEQQRKLRRLNAAIKIQSVWRGHVARTLSRDLKAEMEAFLRMLRMKIDRELVKAYYRANPMEKAGRIVQDKAAEGEAAEAKLGVRLQRQLDSMTARQDLREAEARALLARRREEEAATALAQTPEEWAKRARDAVKSSIRLQSRQMMPSRKALSEVDASVLPPITKVKSEKAASAVDAPASLRSTESVNPPSTILSRGKTLPKLK